jgi:hypothetical protein
MISKKILILLAILIIFSTSKAGVHVSGSWGLTCHSFEGKKNIYYFNASGGIQK